MIELSVVIPTRDDEKKFSKIVERIHAALSANSITYQIIFIDNHSTDNTFQVIESLVSIYPIKFSLVKGKKSKTQALIEGFALADYDLICTLDIDDDYPLEDIPPMVQKIVDGADVVIAHRNGKNASLAVNRFLHNLNYDVQSGLKVFKKEIVERTHLKINRGTVDLQILAVAKNGGYRIDHHDIVFTKRNRRINPIKWSRETGINALTSKFRRAEAVPFHPRAVETFGYGFHYKGKSFTHHSNLHAKETAFHRFSGIQIFTIFTLGIIFLAALSVNWHITLTVFVGLITTLYFADLLFNLHLIVNSFSKSAEIKIAPKEIQAVPEADWPTYTILCPLYKEVHVVPQFVTSMSRLDYSHDKLQVMFLLEEDDTETIEQIRNYKLPPYFTIVVVPHSLPKTKPKACNYGLTRATGEYLVIYDAEDVPDPLQLKKAVLAFAKAPETTVCIQAKLNFYNPHQNLLTRVFTAEYSLWFDLVLTGLQSIHAPIPLGGTSNHFKTEDLHKLKGWDSFNVTEDADLGMRLVKNGYTTAIVDSVTLEEANSSLSNWFGQRSRWIKGYMQTYLVHMRNPRGFMQAKGLFQLITFQLVIGGKILSMFANPVMWVITIIYFAARASVGPFIESFFPAPIFYMGIFSLILGNFLYLYYYLIGCARHGHDELVKYVVFVPFYWLAMSAAAWVALYKLITAPHHWSKTKHGLHLGNTKTAEHASYAIGDALVDTKLVNI